MNHFSSLLFLFIFICQGSKKPKTSLIPSVIPANYANTAIIDEFKGFGKALAKGAKLMFTPLVKALKRLDSFNNIVYEALTKLRLA